ncbi:MAG: cation:proton antiporter [Candidatus Micrarchaeia archaeon]
MPVGITNASITIYMIGIAGVFIIGFLGNMISRKTNIPSIVWLIVFGIILGPVLHIMPRQTLLNLSPIISSIVLIIVLFNAGIRLNIFKSVKAIPITLTLAIGNYIIAALFATAVMLLFNFSFTNSLLIGLIVGGTSAAVVPIISKETKMSDKSRLVATIESIITDPIGIVMTLALLSIIILNNYTFNFVAVTIVSSFSIGIVIGALFAMLWIPTMSYLQRNRYQYSYAATLAVVFLIFPIVQYLNGSGPIAVFTFGLLIANGKDVFKVMRYRNHESFTLSSQSRNFNDLITFFVGSFFFVYLGGLVSLGNLYAFAIGITISAALVVARLIGTHAILRKFDGQDRVEVSSMVSRGMGAGVLATLPIAYGIPGTSSFIDIIAAIIFVTIFANSIMTMIAGRKSKK